MDVASALLKVPSSVGRGGILTTLFQSPRAKEREEEESLASRDRSGQVPRARVAIKRSKNS